MKSVYVSLFALFLLTSCSGSADKKVPELANEMCGCFDAVEKTLSSDALALMKTVSLADDPQSAMMTGIGKLKQEEAVSLAEQLKSIGTKGSAVADCMQHFDKNHSKETTKDKKALMEKLLKEMRANGNCPVGAAIVSLGIKQGIQ
jgi:hypothetical protein